MATPTTLKTTGTVLSVEDLGNTVYNVKAYGATGNGSTDDTAAIQAAITALGSAPGVVFFPAGSYKITSGLTIQYDRQHLVGAGKHTTTLVFAPAAAGVAVAFSRGATVLYQGSLRGISFLSNETTLQKTAIRLNDVSEFVVADVAIGPVGAWTGNTSIGLQIRGRDTTSVLRLSVAADLPISIEDNPNSTIDIDLFHFEDVYLIPADTQPGVKIASGVNLTDVVFDGCNVVAGGAHAFHWSDTATTGTSNNLTIRNFRWEQAASSSGYVVYIAHNYALQNLILEGVKGGSGGANNGFYLRKVKRGTFINTSFEGSNKDALNVAACEELAFINTFWQQNNTVTLTDMEETFAPLEQNFGAYPLRSTAWYDKTGASATRRVRIYGSKVWAQVGALADDGFVQLPLNALQKAGTVMVSAKGSTQFEGGSWIFTNGNVKKTSGTTLTAVGDTDGSLCVYHSGTAVYVKNRLGETVDYDIFVTWY